MAVTRKFLEALGLDEKIVEQIIEAHAETVTGLKANIASAEEEAEVIPSLKKEIASLKKQIEDASNGDSAWQAKYEKVKDDFREFKEQVESERAHETKSNLYKQLLKEAGIADKYLDKVVKVSDLDSVNVVDGKIEKSEELLKTLAEEWEDFIPSTRKEGADVSNPPKSDKSATDGMNLSELMAYANEHPDEASQINFEKEKKE